MADDDEIICPPGKVLNAEGTACIDETVIIGKPESCPVGTTLNLETGECDPIEDEGCPPGFHDDGTGFCVPDDEQPPKECPTGMVRDLETGECVLPEDDTPCADGFHKDETTGLCVPDDDDTPCADGFHRDASGVCVPDEDEPCADGFHRDEATGLCVPDDDEECKDGYEKVDGVCVPVCKEGYIRNLETGTCEKVEKECPTGYTLKDGKCVKDTVITPPVTCQPGYEKVNGVCVPMCQPGYQRVNGVCKKITPETVTTTPINAQGDRTDPIYAEGMDDFNLFATLEELLKENSDKKKDSKKSKEKTKMATGGHLDDLLAEQMTVDDLLKLLR